MPPELLLTLLKELGPTGVSLVAVIFLYSKIRSVAANIEKMENSLQVLLLAQQRNVSIDQLETELKNYMRGDVMSVHIDNMREAIKRCHERVDGLEGKSHKK